MGRRLQARSVAASGVLVVATAGVAAWLMRANDEPWGELADLLAVIVPLGLLWLAATHLALALDLRASLARLYAAGIVGSIALVIVSVLVGSQLMFVSAHDARAILVLLGFSLLVALRAATLLARSTARRLEQLGDGLAELAAGGRTGPLPETGPRELAELAAAANRMARDLDEAEADALASAAARRELVAAVSHDLRTPIAALRLLVEALADEVVTAPGEVAEYHERMGSHLRHLEALVEDLFELSRIDAGDSAWRVEEVPVAGLLEETAEAFDATAAARAVTVETDVGTDVPAVAGSPERLQRVLFNLLANAVGHSPPGGRVLLAASADGAGVRFEVADSGPGIALADAERVFERFYRGGDEAARPVGGSGLGLAIARAIVTAHGGRIWVANPGERGARVAFCVPAAAGRVGSPA